MTSRLHITDSFDWMKRVLSPSAAYAPESTKDTPLLVLTVRRVDADEADETVRRAGRGRVHLSILDARRAEVIARWLRVPVSRASSSRAPSEAPSPASPSPARQANEAYGPAGGLAIRPGDRVMVIPDVPDPAKLTVFLLEIVA